MTESLLPYYHYFSAFLFSAGLYVILTKRNSIFILIGIELMLNAANVFLAIISRSDIHMNGQVIAIFAVVMTVCEVSIALAILLNVYKKHRISNIDELTEVGNE
ncbi:MAG: NADH-quinone oxidoreductase subunit NuoK [Bacteroidota bacterium]